MNNSLTTLETDRLVLRPFDLSDAKDVQRLAGDRMIADTTGNIPHPYEDGMAEKWISKHSELFKEGKGVHFAITDKTNRKFLGAISLMNMIKGHQAELGYWIGKPFWNFGYCTEAARTILEYSFRGLQLNRVHGRHITRNPASGRVMSKIGMAHEGCRRSHGWRWGKFEDLELYGILKADWEQF